MSKLSQFRGGVNTERIKELREKAGISQAELARRLGVTRAAALYIEKPGTYPDASKLPAIANALDCTIDALFGRASASDR